MGVKKGKRNHIAHVVSNLKKIKKKKGGEKKIEKKGGTHSFLFWSSDSSADSMTTRMQWLNYHTKSCI